MRQRAAAGPVLVLESGDDFVERRAPQTAPESLRRRAELIVDAFNRIGVNAYAPGESDLSLGKEILARLSARAHFAFVAANLLDDAGKPLFAPSIVEELGGLRIGVIGLLGRRTGYPEGKLSAAGLTISDPSAAARDEAAKLEKQGVDLLVVLSHLGPNEERGVLEAVPAVRFFVGSHAGAALARPRPIEVASSNGPATAWALDAGARGKQLGLLEIFPGDGAGKWVELERRDFLRRDLETQTEAVQRFRTRLARLDDARRPGESARQNAPGRVALEAAITRAQGRIAEDRRSIEALAAPSAGDTLFRARLLPVEVTTAEDPEIARDVAALEARPAAVRE